MAGFNLTAQINLRGPGNVKKVVSGIQKQLNGLNANVNLNLNKNTVKTLSDANKKLLAINSSLNKVSSSASKANASVAQFAQTINSIGTGNVSIKIQAASKATQQLGKNAGITFKNLKVARTEIEEFGRQSALAIRRFTAFASVTSVIYGVNNAINQALSDFIKFDRQLVRIAQVSGQTVNNLKGLQSTISQLATGIGVSSSSLAEISVTLTQAGFSIRDVQKALKALALTDVAPTFNNLNDTVEGSIALLRQFSISAGDLESSLGSINAVAAKFAVESSDIINAVQRAGGVFAAASRGVSEGTQALNEFIAIFTSVRATTREGAETIATGLRTIFTRLQRESTIDALKEFGVNLQDAEGKFVGAYKAVELLSKGLGSLDPRDIRFSKIVEELGGFRQIGKVIPLIGQFATAQDALRVAQQGQDSLAKSNAQAQAALAIQFARVREEFLKLVRDVAGTDSFKGLVSGALSLASAMIKVADAVKGVIPIIGLLAASKGASAITQFARGFGGGLGRTRGFAKGGTVPGSGNTDSVPAMLTPGEFVLRKSAVRSIGTEKLHKMNKFGRGDLVKQSNFTRTGKFLANTYGSLKNKVDPKQKYSADINPIPVPTAAVLPSMKARAAKKPGMYHWENFEKAVASKYNLQAAGGRSFLDYPSSLGEAKFLKKGATYASDKETGFLKGNNNQTMLAKYVGHMLSKGKYVPGEVDVYYPENINEIKRNLPKPQKSATGGSVQDTVPAMLTPGEFVMNAKSAKAVGYGNLRKMNTRPQGFNKGGIVGYANGGLTGVRGGDIRIGSGLTGQLEALEQAFVSLGLPVDQITNAVNNNGKISRQTYTEFTKQAKANVRLAKASAQTTVERKKAELVEKQLAAVRSSVAQQKTGGIVNKTVNFANSQAFTSLILGAGGAAVALESLNTPLSSFASTLVSSTASFVTAMVAATSAASNFAQTSFGKRIGGALGKIPGLGKIGGLLTKLAGPIGIATTAFGLVSAGVQAYYSYQRKQIELARKLTKANLERASESAAKALEKFSKDASAINFAEVNKRIADQIAAGDADAQQIGRSVRLERQDTTGTSGVMRELGAYITLGYIDSIEDATRNNESKVKAAAKELADTYAPALQNAQNVVFQQFAKGRTLKDLQGAAPGTEEAKALDNLVNAALAADQTYQEQVALATQQGRTLSDAAIQANRERVRADLFGAQGTITLKDKLEQAARAQERLGRLQARLATSFERLASAVEQSANRIEFEAEARQGSIDSIIAAARGEASITEIRSRAANVVDNPLAYTPQQRGETRRNLTANLTPALGERQAREVSALATFDPSVIEKSFTDVANNVAVSAKPSEVGEQIRENLQLEIDKLRAAGAADTAAELQKQADATATIVAGKLEGVDDPVKRQQIIDDSLEDLKKGFNETRDKAVNLAKTFEETRVNALNRFAKNLSEVAQLQNEALKYQQATINVNRNISDSISEIVTGFGPSVNDLIARQQADTTRLTGGPTDPAAIKRNFDALRASSELLQSQLDDAAAAGDTAEAERLATRLTEVNRELNNNKQALEQLAESASKAAEAALAEVNERKRLQDANRAFAETLLSSGPDELKKLDEALVRANQRVNGFIPQAGASQRKRFFELLKQTGSVRQASQGVAAETRAEDLKFLQQTRDVRIEQMIQSGMSREQATQRADQDESRILGQMGREAGLGRLGQQIVGRAVATTQDRRNDPVMRDLIKQYQETAAVQAQANEQLALIASGAANESLIESQNTLRETIDNLNSTIAGSDQRSGPVDVRDPRRGQVAVRRNRGGMIYAADGQYINFEPKGTDTVPAMLTPGEFVVNRSATQKNMGLLQAINGGRVNTYSKGGRVAYLAGGGFAERDTNKDGVITVGTEDASGLNDSNNDGVVTFAEFMTNQSLNDPRTRDYINRVSNALMNKKNVSPLNLLRNEQFMDNLNLFGPINDAYVDYIDNQYQQDLETFQHARTRREEIDKELKAKGLDPETMGEGDGGPFEREDIKKLRKERQELIARQQELSSNLNFNLARQGRGSIGYADVSAERKRLADQYLKENPGASAAEAFGYVDKQMAEAFDFSPQQRAIYDRMVAREGTMGIVAGSGGDISIVRAAHARGMREARTAYLRRRQELIDGGMNPIQASQQAAQNSQGVYYQARDNYFTERATRRREAGIEDQSEKPFAPLNADVAVATGTAAQMDERGRETREKIKEINKDFKNKLKTEAAARQQEEQAQNEQDAADRRKRAEESNAEQARQRQAEQQREQARARAEEKRFRQRQKQAIDDKIAATEREIADKEAMVESVPSWFRWLRSNTVSSEPTAIENDIIVLRQRLLNLRNASQMSDDLINGRPTKGFTREQRNNNIAAKSGVTRETGGIGGRMTRSDKAAVRGVEENRQQMEAEEMGIEATKRVAETAIQAVGALVTLGASAAASSATPTFLRTVGEAAFSGGLTEAAVATSEGDSAGDIVSRTLYSMATNAVGGGIGYGIGRLIGGTTRLFRRGSRGATQAATGTTGTSTRGTDLLDPLQMNAGTATLAENLDNLSSDAVGDVVDDLGRPIISATDAATPTSSSIYADPVLGADVVDGNIAQRTSASATTSASSSSPRGAAADTSIVTAKPTRSGTTALQSSKPSTVSAGVEQVSYIPPDQVPDGTFRNLYQDLPGQTNAPVSANRNLMNDPELLPDNVVTSTQTNNRSGSIELPTLRGPDGKPINFGEGPIDTSFATRQSSTYTQDVMPPVGATGPIDVTTGGGATVQDVLPGRVPTNAKPRFTPEQNSAFESMLSEGMSPEDAATQALRFKSGGMVYANNGALIPFRSRGTDTVPAMLTPGEFVVNREATSKFLPVLRSINSGYDSHNQMVNHLARGGMVRGAQYLQQGGITQRAPNNGVSVDSQIQGIEELRAVVNEFNKAVSSGTENMNNVATQVTSATNQFASTAESINSAATNIPDSVSVAQNVRVDGIPDTLNDFSNNLLNSSVSQATQQTAQQFNDLNTKNEGSLGLPSPNNNAFIA